MPEHVEVGLAILAASAAASAYHGYRRDGSIGWAVVWGLCGLFLPVVTPAVALLQGYAEPKKET